jgi:hypothetical protein
MTTDNGPGDADKRREEIQNTRAELGETVEALTAKADPRALVQQTAAQAKMRIRESAVQAPKKVGQQAVQATKTVGQNTVQRAKQAGQQVPPRMKAARTSVSQVGTRIRGKPAATAAIAAAAVALVVLQRRRRKAVRSRNRSLRWDGRHLVRRPLSRWGAWATKWAIWRG